MSVSASSTVVGVFSDRRLAEQAIEALHNAGIEQEHIRYSHSAETGGFFSELKSLFTGEKTDDTITRDLIDLGFSDEDAQYYSNEYHNGRTILTVQAPGREQDALLLLQQNGAYSASTSTTLPSETAAAAQDESVDEPTPAYNPHHEEQPSAFATEASPVQPAYTEVYAPSEPGHIHTEEEETAQPVHQGEVSTLETAPAEQDLTDEPTVKLANSAPAEVETAHETPVDSVAHEEHPTESEVTASEPFSAADYSQSELPPLEEQHEHATSDVIELPEASAHSTHEAPDVIELPEAHTHTTEETTEVPAVQDETVQPEAQEHSAVTTPEAETTEEAPVATHIAEPEAEAVHETPFAAQTAEPEVETMHETAQTVEPEVETTHETPEIEPVHSEVVVPEPVGEAGVTEASAETTEEEPAAQSEIIAPEGVVATNGTEPQAETTAEAPEAQSEIIAPETAADGESAEDDVVLVETGTIQPIDEDTVLVQSEVFAVVPDTETADGELADAQDDTQDDPNILLVAVPAEEAAAETEPVAATETAQPVEDVAATETAAETEPVASTEIIAETEPVAATETAQPVEDVDELQYLLTHLDTLQQHLADARTQLQEAKERETQLQAAKEREQKLQVAKQQVQDIQTELEATLAELREVQSRISGL